MDTYTVNIDIYIYIFNISSGAFGWLLMLICSDDVLPSVKFSGCFGHVSPAGPTFTWPRSRTGWSRVEGHYHIHRLFFGGGYIFWRHHHVHCLMFNIFGLVVEPIRTICLYAETPFKSWFPVVSPLLWKPSLLEPRTVSCTFYLTFNLRVALILSHKHQQQQSL